MNGKRIYISGAIAHHDIGERMRAFLRAAEHVKAQGGTPVNPFDNNVPVNADWREHMKADIHTLTECDGILMLKGWEQSKGAKLEFDVATSCGLEVWYQYQRKPYCKRHEDNDCLKNPKIRPICFDCKLMQQSEETENVDWWATAPYGRGVRISRRFKRTTCQRTGAKMYVNIHLSDEVTEALDDAGWQAMPTHAEGCKYAKLYRDDYGKND